MSECEAVVAGFGPFCTGARFGDAEAVTGVSGAGINTEHAVDEFRQERCGEVVEGVGVVAGDGLLELVVLNGVSALADAPALGEVDAITVAVGGDDLFNPGCEVLADGVVINAVGVGD